MTISNCMNKSAIWEKCPLTTVQSASPRAIFFLSCKFFPNRTLVRAITYTNHMTISDYNTIPVCGDHVIISKLHGFT